MNAPLQTERALVMSSGDTHKNNMKAATHALMSITFGIETVELSLLQL